MRTLFLQFVRYSWVGLFNTGVGLSVIWALMLAGFGPYIANLAGYIAGLSLSFFLNRAWTFRGDSIGWPVARFLVAFAVAYGANIGTLTVGMRMVPQAVYAIQLVAIGTYSILFFLLCRFFVFGCPRSVPE